MPRDDGAASSKIRRFICVSIEIMSSSINVSSRLPLIDDDGIYINTIDFLWPSSKCEEMAEEQEEGEEKEEKKQCKDRGKKYF